MSLLIDGLSSEKEKFQKTVIYCSSILDVSKMYKYISCELSECLDHIDLFHSGRDGNHSLALILYNSYNSRFVDADVKQVLSIKIVVGQHCYSRTYRKRS